MKIAIAQPNLTVGDLNGNKSKIIEYIETAKKRGAELVVFPEYAISGTPCLDLLRKASFLEACDEALREIAPYCDTVCALIGLPVQEKNKVMSAVAYVENGRVMKYAGKYNILLRSERTFVNQSGGCEYIEINGHKLAVVVGDDILTERKYGESTDTVISLCAYPYYRAIIEQRYEYIKQLAYTTGKNVVFVNHMGGQSNIVYDGSSCVSNKHGEPVCFLKSFEEDIAVIDIDNAPEVRQPVQNRICNIHKAITLGLGDYFRKNGFKKACLGMSGGIDSAVVLAMAAEVLGPENVRILMLPSQFSSEHSISDSVEMAENLGVGYEIISIVPAYEAVTASLGPVFQGAEFDVTEENIQSRLRCVMLMALSNKQGCILLNTSNKSEEAVGYGTLYGDCSGSLGIIGDLYKIEVYELARYINRNKTIIPENIIAKAPSAELRPDQKDSDSLPPYEVMDAILYRFIEEGQEVDEIIGAGFDDVTVRRIVKMVQSAEFKRRQSPPPLRLSARPFASHFILPLLGKFVI